MIRKTTNYDTDKRKNKYHVNTIIKGNKDENIELGFEHIWQETIFFSILKNWLKGNNLISIVGSHLNVMNYELTHTYRHGGRLERIYKRQHL